jgi:hypothetical protein
MSEVTRQKPEDRKRTMAFDETMTSYQDVTLYGVGEAFFF